MDSRRRYPVNRGQRSNRDAVASVLLRLVERLISSLHDQIIISSGRFGNAETACYGDRLALAGERNPGDGNTRSFSPQNFPAPKCRAVRWEFSTMPSGSKKRLHRLNGTKKPSHSPAPSTITPTAHPPRSSPFSPRLRLAFSRKRISLWSAGAKTPRACSTSTTPAKITAAAGAAWTSAATG